MMPKNKVVPFLEKQAAESLSAWLNDKCFPPTYIVQQEDKWVVILPDLDEVDYLEYLVGAYDCGLYIEIWDFPEKEVQQLELTDADVSSFIILKRLLEDTQTVLEKVVEEIDEQEKMA